MLLTEFGRHAPIQLLRGWYDEFGRSIISPATEFGRFGITITPAISIMGISSGSYRDIITETTGYRNLGIDTASYRDVELG